MHPSKDDTNATKRKDVVHHFSASTANPNLFVFMEDIISDYCHETSITRYPTLIKGVKGRGVDRRGYDLLPCTSNWSRDDASEALVSFCKTRLDPKRLKGIYTAPWKFTIPDEPKKKNITKTLEGIDLFAAAMNKHYGTN